MMSQDERLREAAQLSVKNRDLEAENARLQEQVKEAQLQPYAVGPLGEPFFKTKADAERALAQVEGESDRYKALAEEAEEQLRDRVANDLSDYLEVVGRGVSLWNYVDMMLFPKLEGLRELIPAIHAVRCEVERERDRYKAQAELRGEALDMLLRAWVLTHEYGDAPIIADTKERLEIARDAIAITPEEAGEKERQSG